MQQFYLPNSFNIIIMIIIIIIILLFCVVAKSKEILPGPKKDAYQKCSLRSETIFPNWKPFKNLEECFLLNFKSSFLSQDI